MSDNVISLGTRKTLQEDQEERQAAEKLFERSVIEAEQKHQKDLLDLLDQLKSRVKAGELDGLVVTGRNPANGAFLSTAALCKTTRVDTYLAYAGILGAIQIDVTDLANNGPHMNTDGSFFTIAAAEDILEGGEE